MKDLSIHAKLTVLFFALFIIVCLLFFMLVRLERSIQNNDDKFRQENLIKNLLDNYTNNLEMNLQKYLKTSEFSEITDPKIISNVRAKGDIAFRANSENCVLSSVNLDDEVFFDIRCESLNGLFELRKNYRIYNFLIYTFLIFATLIIITYISVLKSLKPLKRLRNQLLQAYNGEKIDFKDYANDEVGKIAAEFEKSFQKNQELISSRKLFLRTIMHELKTPIGKGRIVSEMLQDLKQKQRLIDIFKRLDNLINEFAKIEHLFSKNYDLHFVDANFTHFLEEAKKYLMREDFSEVVALSVKKDIKLSADSEIFSLVLKNLIDNALKYADDAKCELEVDENYILIKNKGKKLSQNYEYYLEAFTREKDAKTAGTGLGLYIVSEICKLHFFSLNYDYIDGKHCFKIDLSKKDE